MTPTPATTASAAPDVAAGDVEPALPQYSVRRVLATWAAAALPMALLAWIGAPVLAG